MCTSESGPSIGRLQQGIDVVGVGVVVLLGGMCLLLSWLLADVVVVITHPFLAAAALGPDQPGPRAALSGQGHLVRTERRAAHHAVHAGALVLADGLEFLTVLEDTPVESAGQTVGLSCQHDRDKQETQLW